MITTKLLKNLKPYMLGRDIVEHIYIETDLDNIIQPCIILEATPTTYNDMPKGYYTVTITASVITNEEDNKHEVLAQRLIDEVVNMELWMANIFNPPLIGEDERPAKGLFVYDIGAPTPETRHDSNSLVTAVNFDIVCMDADV